MGIYCIYKYTSPSGKSYIGQTNNLKRRIEHHKKPSSKCHAFSSALKKYGIDAFKCEILKDGLSIDESNYWEMFFIKSHKTLWPNGYNLKTGGDHSVPSEKTRNNMSIAMKGKGIGRILTEETRKKISQANKGLKRSKETRKKLSIIASNMSEETKEKIASKLRGVKIPKDVAKKAALARVGLKRSLETKQKMSKSATGKVFNESHKKSLSISRSGTMFFNNGIINIRTKTCPDGFVKGRLSNHKGYSYVDSCKKWRVSIYVYGKSIHIGYFLTEIEAKNARENAINKYIVDTNKQSTVLKNEFNDADEALNPEGDNNEKFF